MFGRRQQPQLPSGKKEIEPVRPAVPPEVPNQQGIITRRPDGGILPYQQPTDDKQAQWQQVLNTRVPIFNERERIADDIYTRLERQYGEGNVPASEFFRECGKKGLHTPSRVNFKVHIRQLSRASKFHPEQVLQQVKFNFGNRGTFFAQEGNDPYSVLFMVNDGRNTPLGRIRVAPVPNESELIGNQRVITLWDVIIEDFGLNYLLTLGSYYCYECYKYLKDYWADFKFVQQMLESGNRYSGEIVDGRATELPPALPAQPRRGLLGRGRS